MKIKIIVALAISTLAANAQTDIFAPVLEQIARNNGRLSVARLNYEATAAENSTGLTPDNPEVEFGYLVGESGSNRKDFKLTQNLELPSVYKRKSQLQKELTSGAEHLLRAENRDVMLQAKELLIDLVYNNALRKIASTQTDIQRKLMDSYIALAEKGEATAIDVNKANLSYDQMEAELMEIDAERKRLLDELAVLNGGEIVTFDACEYATPLLPNDFGSWLAESIAKNPDFQYLDSEARAGQKSISLAKSEGFPKFSVGFQGEYLLGDNFQGVVIGMSIPLWANKNKVKAATARHKAAVQAAETARATYSAQMRQLFEQAKNLELVEQRYIHALSDHPIMELLDKQLSLGRINLTEYYIELQNCYDNQRNLLDVQRRRASVIAKLTANN